MNTENSSQEHVNNKNVTTFYEFLNQKTDELKGYIKSEEFKPSLEEYVSMYRNIQEKDTRTDKDGKRLFDYMNQHYSLFFSWTYFQSGRFIQAIFDSARKEYSASEEGRANSYRDSIARFPHLKEIIDRRSHHQFLTLRAMLSNLLALKEEYNIYNVEKIDFNQMPNTIVGDLIGIVDKCQDAIKGAYSQGKGYYEKELGGFDKIRFEIWPKRIEEKEEEIRGLKSEYDYYLKKTQLSQPQKEPILKRILVFFPQLVLFPERSYKRRLTRWEADKKYYEGHLESSRNQIAKAESDLSEYKKMASEMPENLPKFLYEL